MERYPVVRQFLPKLCTIVESGATAEAAAVLYAVTDLPELLMARPTKKVPTGFPARTTPPGYGLASLSKTSRIVAADH